MWGRIVFGTDGSPAATRAGEVAATIARATSAKLIATSGYRASSVGAEERLAEALDVAEAAGMRRARARGGGGPGRGRGRPGCPPPGPGGRALPGPPRAGATPLRPVPSLPPPPAPRPVS